MPETPLPSPHLDDPDNGSLAADSRTRRRSTGPHRPVSAFAPAQPSRHESSPPGQLTSQDASFVSALHEAGVALELDGTELARAARAIQHETAPARRIDMLEAYYASPDDPLAGQRRRATDRWFLYRADERLSANQLIHEILAVMPELSDVRLERIGGADGALLLRAGEHVCAVDDEAEQAPGLTTVSVRDVVRAVNVLFDRHQLHTRLVGLIGDGAREAYVGVGSIAAAIALVEADYLAPIDTEALLQLTGW